MNTQLGYPEFYEGTAWIPIGADPTAPSSVVATNSGAGRAFNNGQASVAFTAGTVPGSSYTVTSSPGSYYNTGASSPILVSGLQSNTSYTFTATASNVYNTSAASSASSAITATTVPQAPTIGTATGGNAQASVTFTANATGGSSITGFTVTSSPGGLTATGSSSPLVVTGLTNGTAYTFTAVATNANGSSAASSASNSITAAELEVLAFESIATWTAGSGMPNFINIPSTYKHLQLRWFARTNRADPNGYLTWRINQDSSANYGGVVWYKENGEVLGSGYYTGGTEFGTDSLGGTSAGSSWGSGEVTFLNYANTNMYKTIIQTAGNTRTNLTGDVGYRMGYYKSTSAINRIDFIAGYAVSALETGSYFALYGIKG
jgi:hypothetical protein